MSGSKRKAKELKLIVMRHYSDGPPKCACCGEQHVDFLTIDHINGGGNKHRIKVRNEMKDKPKKSGAPFYRWLIDNDFPEGFQVLCSNCNMAKGRKPVKYCPVHHPELYNQK